MKKLISRREALQWMALTATAFLVACQNIVRPTPNTGVVDAPSPTSTALPEPTATPQATATAQPTATSQPAILQETKIREIQIPAQVYMTKDITAEGLMNIYKVLGITAGGKVAVKISSGEPGGHYFLSPELITPLVNEVNGTIVECNTAYGGGRGTTESHQRVMEQHGFTAIAPVDIMDADGSINLPITGGNISRKMWLDPISPIMILWSTWRISRATKWAVLAVLSKTCRLG